MIEKSVRQKTLQSSKCSKLAIVVMPFFLSRVNHSCEAKQNRIKMYFNRSFSYESEIESEKESEREIEKQRKKSRCNQNVYIFTPTKTWLDGDENRMKNERIQTRARIKQTKEMLVCFCIEF